MTFNEFKPRTCGLQAQCSLIPGEKPIQGCPLGVADGHPTMLATLQGFFSYEMQEQLWLDGLPVPSNDLHWVPTLDLWVQQPSTLQTTA